MDMTESIIPKSDQLNADDLMTGPRTVTIEKVSAGSAEQPVDVFLVEFPGRAFRPSKSMRRVMVAAWAADTSAYTGHRMTLYRDPTIRFGREEVGGIRISHMSHITKTLKLALTVSRGKREAFVVEPLAAGTDKPATYSAAAEKELIDAGADMGDRWGTVITEKQLGFIGSLMKKLAMTDKDAALDYVRSVINRDVASSAELSSFEASKLIKALEAKLAAEAGGAE